MDHDQLCAVMQLHYQKEQQKLATLLKQESVLRADLAKLRAHELRQRDSSFPLQFASGALGGDVLWQKWLAKTRSELNMQLAQVLVQKARHVDSVRTAFGKKQVAAALAEKAKKEKARRLAGDALYNAIEIGLDPLSNRQ